MDKQRHYKNLLKKLSINFSTLWGLGGSIPMLKGTFGSLLGVFFFLLLGKSPIFPFLVILILLLSFPATAYTEKILHKKDAPEIIIDDFSGMLISLLFIPYQINFIVLAFILFRIFDFLKVFPANLIEKQRGGIAIVGDDLIAGIYTNLLLQLFRCILKISS